MIGILCAMDQEVAALYEMIQQPEITEISGYRFAVGRPAGKDVVVAKCGVGKVNAAICAQTMLLTYHPELVMNSGVAGSLSEKLRICDVAVGQDIVQHDIDTTACGDELALVPELDRVYLPCDGETARVICRAAEKVGVHALPARIASGDQFVSFPEKKRWIVEHFGAMACEMESGAIAQVCCRSGVKCAVIRAISDSTDGEHAMEFEKFLQIAADQSVKVLLEALKAL